MRVNVVITMIDVMKNGKGIIESIHVDKDWHVEEFEFDGENPGSWGAIRSCLGKQFEKMKMAASVGCYDVPAIFNCDRASYSYLDAEDGGTYEIDLDVMSFIYKDEDFETQYLFVPEIILLEEKNDES